MRLAYTAKLTVDPKKVLESRWAHDAAHMLLASLVKARGLDRRREPRSKN